MPKNRPNRREEEVEEEEEEEPREFAFPTPVDPEQLLASLPAVVRKRVKVLKAIQKNYQATKKAFDEELRQLEKKYDELYKPIFARRSEIVQGVSEVSEQEVLEAQKLEEEEKKKREGQQKGEEQAAKAEEQAVKAEEQVGTPKAQKSSEQADIKGIPEFWSKVLLQSEIAGDMIQPHDEESLKHLVDITIEDFDDGKRDAKSKGFHIIFHYSENPFFANKTLKKSYYVDPEDDSIETFDGCDIEWKEGKNLTKKIVIKKQKHKTGKQTRQVKKEEPQDSFYNFFKNLEEPEDNDEDIEEFEQLMDTDFDIAQTIKERIIPNAIEYYLGESNTSLANMIQALRGEHGDDDDGEEGDEQGTKNEQGAKNEQGGDNPQCKQQ